MRQELDFVIRERVVGHCRFETKIRFCIDIAMTSVVIRKTGVLRDGEHTIDQV